MEQEKMASGQLHAAVWAAVLAPGVSVLPGLCAGRAGAGGWLAPLIALSVLVPAGRVLAGLSRAGLARRFLDLLGGVWGRVLTIIYIMWALLLGSARLRMSGQRIIFAGRQETGLWFFLVVLAVTAGWLALGKVGVFLRTGAVFSGVLTPALAVVILLTAAQVKKENLFPLWIEDVPGILWGSVFALGVLCYGVYGAFLDNGDGVGRTGKVVGGCVLLAALLASVLGNMGAELSQRLADPFLTLGKYVGVEGAFQRVESLVAALWVLGDLALLGLLLSACRCMAAVVVPGWNGKWVVLGGAAALLLGSGVLFRDAVLARRFEYELAPLGNLALGVGVPVLLLLLDRKKNNGISCACGDEKKQM
ncbi:MAG: hypothetical protein E7440_07590 [Ruminococcaceae bacterium]|nr:hypothetical protein [Oscillospiraceae bacterium]